MFRNYSLYQKYIFLKYLFKNIHIQILSLCILWTKYRNKIRSTTASIFFFVVFLKLSWNHKPGKFLGSKTNPTCDFCKTPSNNEDVIVNEYYLQIVLFILLNTFHFSLYPNWQFIGNLAYDKVLNYLLQHNKISPKFTIFK